ncbi:MBL fold metallo-hydrolase [soil metagenome]
MIPFVREIEFEYGRCDQVSPLIQRVICRNPGPFTYTGTGTYIVGRATAGAEVCVIDPGPDDPVHQAALVAALEGRRVSHILVTHTHSDHSPLARPLAALTGAVVLGARPPAAETHASVLAADAGDARTEEGDDDAFQPDVVLTGGELIRATGWTLEAIATPGHASNHLCFALVEENALFSGDHVMGWSTTVVAPPDGDMSDYMTSLDAVITRDFATLWPTHGAPVTDPAPFLDAYRAHRMAREGQVIERLAVGDRRIAEMIPRLYAAVDERLWPAASLSILAHLQKLVRDGRVRAEPDTTMGARFSPIADSR